MSFHNTASLVPYFLSYWSIPTPFFKFKIFVLNTSLFTFYATLCSWYDYVYSYNTVEQVLIIVLALTIVRR